MGEEHDHGWKYVRGRNRQERGNNQYRIDIATNQRRHKEKEQPPVTYFFTNFPETFGAKALSNVFQKYGDIAEVVIPARRDRRGERYGFARFDNVIDIRKFEYELDGIIIGRDKLSVNISRFQRPEKQLEPTPAGTTSAPNRHDRKGWDDRNFGRKEPDHIRESNSFAMAVKKGKENKSKPRQPFQGPRRVCFRVGNEVLDNFKGAFVGTVLQPGMSYNIQEEFHMQGYFGIKITPLGANLVLLEEQEGGEMQALQADAKEWLDQWFCHIKPWEPCMVDNERVMWVRVYGIPVHAWHVDFFELICKAYGTFINADVGTTKKNTMDVARLMLRTKGHKVVDDVFEAIINGEIYSLRIIEDSYGPMRILIPPVNTNEGRDASVGSSDEEEEPGYEEVVESLDGHDHDEEVREIVGEAGHSLALFANLNSNGNNSIVEETDDGSQQEGENQFNAKDNMLLSHPKVIIPTCDRSNESRTGPTSTSPATASLGRDKGDSGAISKPVGVDDMGCVKPKRILKKLSDISGQNTGVSHRTGGTHDEPVKSVPSRSKLAATTQPPVCSRNPAGKIKKSRIMSNSVSSAGAILCCSSLHSSDIRNCNNLILKQREKEVTSKVWNGAKDLGVKGGADEAECIRQIHNNESRDVEGRRQREQLKKVPK
ncbi:hypothetical protein L195_g016577 [Trifolium pratense]|uniref:RRM domain-containing protein n=1 Tax=Trifolium pratense TaxID=57577 RepID=A0A2K3MRI9_TRIPR|nr:hypothetical protein L195_g016577 [Trifolium pratense]